MAQQVFENNQVNLQTTLIKNRFADTVDTGDGVGRGLVSRGRILQVLADMREQLALPGTRAAGIYQLAGAPREDALE